MKPTTPAMLALFAAAIFLSFTQLRAEDKAPATSPDQAGVTKFYGTISAVDTAAKTFTVDNQVYSIVGESHMTKSDDSAATIADAVVGEPARGTYTKSADGKMNVTKVRFGKKAGGKGGKSGGKGGGKGEGKGAATTQSAEHSDHAGKAGSEPAGEK